MNDFFPHGFWPAMTMFWMVVFLVFGVDLLLFKARLVNSMGRYVNKRIHVDQIVIYLLENLKKNSDREFDVERSLLGGRGRFLAGAVLIIATALMYKLLSVLK